MTGSLDLRRFHPGFLHRYLQPLLSLINAVELLQVDSCCVRRVSQGAPARAR
jgi:hypothetical protein